MKTLCSVIEQRKEIYLEDGEVNKFAIPEFITQNLKYPLFEWQKRALENFLIFENLKSIKDFPDIKNHPTHLLFNMATGSGKTLMMAALILYYYEKGYRHFLFFVNKNNIVDKTENNFVESSHNKFLFQDKIVHQNSVVPIKKVDTFNPYTQGIEIKFTSIQKLYNDIHNECENKTTLADLHQLKIVMLGDEAHHLNAQTKGKKTVNLDFTTELSRKASSNEIERNGWEHMVLTLLLNKNGKPSENVLLEFTATLPENEEVRKKYADKVITQFALKEFLQAGFTKEINLVSSQLDKKERVLHALLFAWYRHQIALKYAIPNFKPVMLFRSKTIDDSRADYLKFLQWTANVSAENFAFLNTLLNKLNDGGTANEQSKTRTEQALRFMSENSLTIENLVSWVKESYQPHNVVITNSQTNKTNTEKTDSETERLLNNLESPDNPIRAIFTVERLTEGWDVLNLFDIVRLYEGTNGGGTSRNSSNPPAATVSEKQLIGRGVRYFPFAFEDKLPNKRKFDGVEHELKILEELFYYTFDEQSRYISELKAELRKDGYVSENSDQVKVRFAIKPELAQNESFRNLLIWTNEKVPNPNAKANNAASLKELNPHIEITVHSNGILQETLFQANAEKDTIQQIGREGNHSKTLAIGDIERHIFDKALHIKGKCSNSLFHFCRLKEKLGLMSRCELQNDLMKDWKIEFLELDETLAIPPDEKLRACLIALKTAEQHLLQNDNPFIGTEKFTPKKLWDIFGKPKEKWVSKDTVKQLVAAPDWYVIDNFAGTSLEERLVQFVKDRVGNLAKYDFYLLRNEEVLKLSNFENGKGFMPDFILLLKDKEKNIDNDIQHLLHYQIFIEPKGNHLTEKDFWKADFLKAITKRYGKEGILYEDISNYRLIGLPFYMENSTDFAEAFKELMK